MYFCVNIRIGFNDENISYTIYQDNIWYEGRRGLRTEGPARVIAYVEFVSQDEPNLPFGIERANTALDHATSALLELYDGNDLPSDNCYEHRQDGVGVVRVLTDNTYVRGYEGCIQLMRRILNQEMSEHLHPI